MISDQRALLESVESHHPQSHLDFGTGTLNVPLSPFDVSFRTRNHNKTFRCSLIGKVDKVLVFICPHDKADGHSIFITLNINSSSSRLHTVPSCCGTIFTQLINQK